jgi:EmrB/QacA subfamily drug resistance transporter
VAVSVAYVTGTFMSSIDNHIVNVALPSISRTFHSPLATAQWTVIGYVLSLAIWMPASGWIGDRVGTKRTFLFALAVFTGASALCGQARSMNELIAARVLQGVGGGMLVPVGTAMLYRAYPPAERARVTRILMLPILIGPAAAPVIGGLLVEKLSWRWAFYVNVPIGVATLAFCALYLVEHREPPQGRFDIGGFVLSASGLSLLLYAISEGSLTGWSDPQIIVCGLAGLMSGAGFVWWELRRAHPLLKLRLLEDRLFRATNIVTSLNLGGFLGALFLAPIFLQEGLGLSPLTSGLTTFVSAVGVFCASQPIGRLYPRLGPRRMAAAGSGGLALLLCSFLLFGPGSSLWPIRTVMFMMGLVNSATILSGQASMYTGISSSDTGHASAILSTQRQVSMAFSVAILTTIVTSHPHDKLLGFHAAFGAAALMALLGAIAALALIKDDDARATMVTQHRDPSLPSENRS